MVSLHLRFPGVLWAVWVVTSWDGPLVLDYQSLPRCGCGVCAVQQLPPDLSHKLALPETKGQLESHSRVGTIQNECPPQLPENAKSLCLVHTGKPTGVVVSHCITWFQTQLILTTCQICYRSHCGIIVALDSSEP